MHHIHNTKSIIIKSIETGEADKRLTVLTEDLGLLSVLAIGIRKEKSKLKQSVQSFSISDLALVYGRTGWRLTNANLHFNLNHIIKNKGTLAVFQKVFYLIDRMVAGQDAELKVFSCCENFIDFAINNQNNIDTDEKNEALEIIFVLKILHELGYLDKKDFSFYIENEISLFMIDRLNNENSLFKKDCVKTINNSIKESHL